MKYNISVITLSLMLIISLFVFSACGKTYNKEDIEVYVRNELGLTKFVVSNDYKEFVDEEGYTDKVWGVKDLENNIPFHVMNNYYYGMEWVENHLDDDYEYIALKKYYDSLSNKSTHISLEKNSTEINTYVIKGTFKNKVELKECFDELYLLKKFYGNNYNNNSYVEFELYYDFPENRKPYITTIDENISGFLINIDNEKNGEYSITYEDMLNDYFSIGIHYYIEDIMKEMSDNDREKACNSQKNNTIINTDTEVVYHGLLSRMYGGVSISTFYEILKTEGYNLSGTPENYSFMSKHGDGEEYTFSYDFCEDIGDGSYYFYYLKNDEKVELRRGIIDYYDIGRELDIHLKSKT